MRGSLSDRAARQGVAAGGRHTGRAKKRKGRGEEHDRGRDRKTAGERGTGVRGRGNGRGADERDRVVEGAGDWQMRGVRASPAQEQGRVSEPGGGDGRRCDRRRTSTRTTRTTYVVGTTCMPPSWAQEGGRTLSPRLYTDAHAAAHSHAAAGPRRQASHAGRRGHAPDARSTHAACKPRCSNDRHEEETAGRGEGTGHRQRRGGGTQMRPRAEDRGPHTEQGTLHTGGGARTRGARTRIAQPSPTTLALARSHSPGLTWWDDEDPTTRRLDMKTRRHDGRTLVDGVPLSSNDGGPSCTKGGRRPVVGTSFPYFSSALPCCALSCPTTHTAFTHACLPRPHAATLTRPRPRPRPRPHPRRPARSRMPARPRTPSHTLACPLRTLHSATSPAYR